jgi:hypothetical protein
MPDFAVPATMDPSFSDVLHGRFSFKGVLIYVDGTLTYRYRNSGLFGGSSDPVEWTIELADLRSVSFKWFGSGSRLIVSPKRLHKFDDLPGDHGAAIKFKVRSADRADAKEIAAAIRRDLSDDHDMEYEGVPFRLPDVGFQELRGVMYLEPELLVLDISVQLMTGGRVDSHVLKLGAEAISGLSIKRGTVWDRVSVRVSDPTQLHDMPFVEHDTIRLRIARRHRKEADAIVRVVQMRRDMV